MLALCELEIEHGLPEELLHHMSAISPQGYDSIDSHVLSRILRLERNIILLYIQNNNKIKHKNQATNTKQ